MSKYPLLRYLRHEYLDRDYPNDCQSKGGKGIYFNVCASCDKDFLGHKGRLTCRTCKIDYRKFRSTLTEAELKKHDDEKLLEFIEKAEELGIITPTPNTGEKL